MLEKLPDAIGEALDGVRAGITHTAMHASGLRAGLGVLVVTSGAFVDHAPLPRAYTADGDGTSPSLHWSGAPAGATEAVLIVEDADSPTPSPLVHAIACGLAIDADGRGEIADGALVPDDAAAAPGAPRLGRNSLLTTRWLPPDPPPGHGVHRYVFQVFALGPGDPLPDAPGRDALIDAVRQRALAAGSIVATYERSTRIDERAQSPQIAPLGTVPLADA